MSETNKAVRPSDEAGLAGDGRAAEALRPTGPCTRVSAQASRVPVDPCIRAENEDDDGYDPYSDRRPTPEPLFERDPWA